MKKVKAQPQRQGGHNMLTSTNDGYGKTYYNLKKTYSCQRTELGNLTSAGQAWSPTMAAGSTRQVETPSNSAEARGVLQSCKNMSDMSKLSSVTSRWIGFEYIRILNCEVSEIPIHMHLTTHQEEGFVWRRSLGSLAWPGMARCQPCKGALLLLGIGHPPPRLDEPK